MILTVCGQEVHMTYLQIAVEGGIPSLILFLLFFRERILESQAAAEAQRSDPRVEVVHRRIA